MKKLSLLFLLVFAGCASQQLASYIQDENPYEKVYYADFNQTYNATLETLQGMGWTVEKETAPSVYERTSATDATIRQTLLITEIKKIWSVTGKKQARLNIYLKTDRDGITHMQIRYLALNPVTGKVVKDYSNDDLVNRMFDHIKKKLNQ